MPAPETASDPVLQVHTIPWPQPNPLLFLRRSTGQPRFFWESDHSPVALAGFGAAVILRAAGPGRFEDIRAEMQKLSGRIRPSGETAPHEGLPSPLWFGGFSFTGGRDPEGLWQPFGEACFILPKYLLTRSAGQSWLTVCAVDADPFAAQDALWELPAPYDVPPPNGHPAHAVPDELMSAAAWAGLVDAATAEIASGELGKVVLARAVEIRAALNPLAVVSRLAARYPDCYRFLFEPEAGRAFFGATPELLARRAGRCFSTMALAGSARRGATLEEDESLGQDLLDSAKDRREHEFVVRAIEMTLAGLVRTYEKHATRLLKLSNIQHLQTPFTGEICDETDLLEMVAALHPTPAVGGIPRAGALDFIEAGETVSRGWYASPVGWLDFRGNGEFAVALRSAVTDGRTTRLYAGAGIVADSDPEHEWRETRLKFRPMLEAIL